MCCHHFFPNEKTPKKQRTPAMTRTKLTSRQLTGDGRRVYRKKPPQGRVRRKRRFRPGAVALREIKKYQKSTELLIRKRKFYFSDDGYIINDTL